MILLLLHRLILVMKDLLGRDLNVVFGFQCFTLVLQFNASLIKNKEEFLSFGERNQVNLINVSYRLM